MDKWKNKMSRTVITAEDFTAGVIEGVQTTLITENEVNQVLSNQITPNITHLIKLLSGKPLHPALPEL